jgi:pantothenate kinase
LSKYNRYAKQNLTKHNRVHLYFDDEMMKNINKVVSDMILVTNQNCNQSDAVRYLITEGFKNYEFYTRYNARVDFKKKQRADSNNQDESLQET